MPSMADLTALAAKIPFRSAEWTGPPTEFVYRFTYSNAGPAKFEGDKPGVLMHIYCASGKVRAQHGEDAPPRAQAGVFGPAEAFAMGPGLTAPLEFRKHLRAGDPDFRDYAAQVASSNALPLMATHHAPTTAISEPDFFRVIAANKDGQWRLDAIRDEALGKERCVFVQATHAKAGVSKWWLGKDRSYALVAIDHQSAGGRFATVMNVDYDGSPSDKPLCKTLTTHQRVKDKTQGYERYELVESKPWAEVPGWFEAKSFGVTEQTTAGMVVPGLGQSRYGNWPLWLGLVAVAVLLTLAGLYLRRRGRR